MGQKHYLNCYIYEYSKKEAIGMNITQVYNDNNIVFLFPQEKNEHGF